MRYEAALLAATFRVHATFPSRGVAGATVHESSELTWVDSGLDTDTFNVVLGSRLSGDRAGRAIEEVRTHFASVGRPFSWWVSPGDEPDDLAERLATAGLVAEEWELAMACRIADIPVNSSVRGLTIERARDEAALCEFARINAENWTPPEALVERCYRRAVGKLLATDSPLRFYVARSGGEPVAAVEVALAGAAVGVYNLSTRLPHRGVGIGGALLAHALREAAYEVGAHTAVLQAAPAAAGLYRRAGFSEFGRITEFKPSTSV
jgi:ribosomal protein S18 acetylase RimI-like enzyme